MEQPKIERRTSKAPVSRLGIIEVFRNMNFSLQKALLELIDNAVDENATEVSITEIDGDLKVIDNGKGFNDLMAAMTFATSGKTDSIGRYGIGLKNAALRYSNATIIESNGSRVTAAWDELLKRQTEDELEFEDIENTPLTKIVFEGFRDRFPRGGIQTEQIRKSYHSLIASGRLNLTVNGVDLRSLDLPEFTESISEEFAWRDRKVLIEGGIYRTDDPARRHWNGYSCFYKERLIGTGNITDCGVGDEGCTTFAFLVHLVDDNQSWRLATNKDEVEDVHELLEYCYDTFTHDLLKRGAEQTQEIELASTQDKVNAALGSGDTTKRNQTRGEGDRTGTVKPRGTSRRARVTHSDDDQGKYEPAEPPKRTNAKLSFRFEHMDGNTLGAISHQKRRSIISLNLNNQFIAEHKTEPATMYALVKMIYCVEHRIREKELAISDYMSPVLKNCGVELEHSQKAL